MNNTSGTLLPVSPERRSKIPLYHISNYRTPLKPTFHDWRNLSDLPSDEEREYCWKCGLKTKQMNCPKCGADKFYMTNK